MINVTETVTFVHERLIGRRSYMAFEKLEREKQNKIINAACEVFTKHGYKKASMKDIAEVADISKSVLFKYFSTKENLFVKMFAIAADSISQADGVARAEVEQYADMFSLMRHTAKTRLYLFNKYPWIYKFSYAATFDPDPFVTELVKREFENYRQVQHNMMENKEGIGGITDKNDDFRGLRDDISPAIAKQLIFWISQGYLEDKLVKNEIDPEGLEQGFEKWIDILEILLKKRNEAKPDRKDGDEND